MSLVRQIAYRNGSWYYYDTNFRRIKQSMNLLWSDIEQELFITAMTKRPQPFRAGREGQSDKRSFHNTSKSKAVTNTTRPHIAEVAIFHTSALSAEEQTIHNSNVGPKTRTTSLMTSPTPIKVHQQLNH